MLEPPDVSPAAIPEAVHTAFGLRLASLAFLPSGNDARSFVYRGTAGGAAYFVKLRAGPPNEAALAVPRFLAVQGVPHILAPLPTATGALSSSVGAFTLALYPFVEAPTGMQAGLTDAQWIAYGATLRQVHAAALPPALAALIRRESFTPAWTGGVLAFDARLGERDLADPLEQALTEFWQEHRAEIRMLAERAEARGRELRARGLPLVVCHADAHTANVLVEPDGQFWLVDWDETRLAPKERDLMFVDGGIIGAALRPRDTALFYQGYGPAEVDSLALAYYRDDWAVQDMGEYARQVFGEPPAGEATRRAGLEGFRSLFEPGNIVELALASGPPAV
jgi:spectinomycin phosphotransferase